MVGVLALGVAVPVAAQDVPRQLSIEDAIRIARENNPAFRKSLNDVDVEDMSVRNRWAAFLPSVSGSVGFGGSYSERLTAEDEFGQPLERQERLISETSSARQSLNLSMNLFDGGQSIANLRAARASRDATFARIETEGHRLDADVQRDYFAVTRAESLILLEQRLLAARKEELDRTRRLLNLASSKYVDVLSAEVNVADAERALDDARAAAEKARLALLERLGVAGGADFVLSTDPPEIFDPAQLDTDALVRQAVEANPIIRAAEAQLFAQSRQLSAARGGRLPTLSLSAGLERGISGAGYGQLGNFNPDANRGISFSFGINIPLFNRFSTSLDITRASAAEADAREEVRAQKLAIERGVRSALIDLGNAYRGVQMAQRKVDLSREQLAAAEEEYRLGAMTFINLQQIINSAAAAERQLIDARFNFVNNLIMLEQQVGSNLER